MPLPLVTRATKGRPTTDHPNASPAPAPVGRVWLTRLFTGELVLPALVPAGIPSADRAAVEADAAARALTCHDLFVIDTPDRIVRERVTADLIRAAAGRGERVLALSPDPAAADRLAEAVAADHAIPVVRALADDENPHRPSAVVSRLTSVAVGMGRVDKLKREAAAAVAGWEAQLARLVVAADRLGQVQDLHARLGVVEGEQADLVRRLDGLAAAVRDEADGKPNPTGLTETIARLRADCDAISAPLAADRAAAAALREEKEAVLATARQHITGMTVEVGRKPSFFARLLGKPKHPADPVDLDRQVHDLEREVKDLADREAKFQAGIDAAAGRFLEEREKSIADEITARRAALELRLRELAEEKEQLGRVLREPRSAPGGPDEDRPAAAARADAERELAAARARLDELDRSGGELVRRFLGEMRVVVGTPGSLAADSVFEPDPDRPAPPFGLLVLDHAEELTEPDFARLSRLAGRWVLAGDAARPEEFRPGGNGSGSVARQGRPPALTFLARLARLLDREPWAIEGGQLVFRLAHMTPDQRRELTREPVLDRPEVELRVATAGAGEPVLAEIAFPAATPVAEAKAFLFAQLGEVLLRPCGECRWVRTADRLTACWPAAETGAAVAGWVDLEPGVREKVAGVGVAAFTGAVAFDPAAGWDEEKAERWLAARLPGGSPGRVAVLPRAAGYGTSPHRPVASV
ncbi:MAG: hypothetical protein JWO38_6895 [Gemmataceae bacterium]|nr:hypothetical protein [Gemmataceae bacterium]